MVQAPAALAPAAPRVRRRRFDPLAVWGPGLVVMLADTDAGCLITAAQSGAQWGYALLLPQLVLVPVLYLVQEMTVRLGLHTGKGHGQLIREHVGRGWSLLSSSTLLLSAIGALLTELAAVAGVGELFGVSRWLTVPIATAALVALAWVGGYRRVEKIGVLVGLAELLFVAAMVMARPHGGELVRGLGSFPIGHSSYAFLLAANIGAVVMPWMIFYQQAAVVGKRLRPDQLRSERRDTAVGTVITQGIMIVVIVTFAATVWRVGGGSSLNTVGDMASALRPFLGHDSARVLVGAAVLGGALVAAIVVSLAGSWGLAEVFGWRHRLEDKPNRSNAKFYGTYIATHLVGAAVVLSGVNVVRLAVDVQVMNALLLPIVLGFLLLLERRALPAHARSYGLRRWTTTGLCVVVICLGLYVVPSSLGW